MIFLDQELAMTAGRTPDPNTPPLPHLEIPVPCTESWDAMEGDERVRHCGLCRKNVYNLSALPQAEAAALLAGDVDGQLCVRFYRRSDGSVMTSDCSTSPRVRLHRAMRTLPRTAAGAAGVAAAAAVAVAVAHVAPLPPGRARPHPSVVEVSLVPEMMPPVLMGVYLPISEPATKARSARKGKRHADTQARRATDGDPVRVE
ncbi:hypothetical protein G4G28_03105 [Massilia sp. Dwa41.01b]|uniref:hypothetical protein n=1 Tax=Massilia sp. Dwa41.01b TaxID=2709302 RepID=UPI0016038815|nr:hypothetical protein [Massilia sp. Dwa41.01b]QNA87712.1 hypothetical protein G4G28_03105 [Massilia sp. Dwa41.01b]